MLDRLRNERGATAVIVGVTITMLCGFAALVVDLGMLFEERRYCQTAADAAALAGVQELPDDPSLAIAVAQDYLSDEDKYGLDISGVDISSYITVYTTHYPNDTIRVVVPPQQVDFGFAQVMGFSNSTVSAEAEAIVGAGSVGKGTLPWGLPYISDNPGNVVPLKLGFPDRGNVGAVDIPRSPVLPVERTDPVDFSDPIFTGPSPQHYEENIRSGSNQWLLVGDQLPIIGVTGHTAGVLTQGLIGERGANGEGGRLTSPLHGETIDWTRPDWTIDNCDDVIDNGRSDCSRLGIVPVVSNTYPIDESVNWEWPPGASDTVYVVGFRVVFIQDLATNGAPYTGQVTEVQARLLTDEEVKKLPGVTIAGPYTPGMPKAFALIK